MGPEMYSNPLHPWRVCGHRRLFKQKHLQTFEMGRMGSKKIHIKQNSSNGESHVDVENP